MSRGDVEAGRSTGVSGAADEPQSAAKARLAALEHVLDAVLVLLEAGKVGRATALLRAWRVGDCGDDRARDGRASCGITKRRSRAAQLRGSVGDRPAPGVGRMDACPRCEKVIRAGKAPTGEEI